MAIECLAAVINARKAPWKGGDLTVLLLMANYADPDGTNIFPSIDRMARSCRMSVRGVQTCIANLLEDTVLRRVEVASGRPGLTNLYEIDMARVTTFEGCKVCGGVVCQESGCSGPSTRRQNLRGYGCRIERGGVQNPAATGAKRGSEYRQTRQRPVKDLGTGTPRAPERRGDPALWERLGGNPDLEKMALRMASFDAVITQNGGEVLVDFEKAWPEQFMLPLRRQVQAAMGCVVVWRFAGKVAA